MTGLQCNKCKIQLGKCGASLYDVFLDFGFGEFESIHQWEYEEQFLTIHKSEMYKFKIFMERNNIIKKLEKTKNELEKKFLDKNGYINYARSVIGTKKEKEYLKIRGTLETCRFYKDLYKHCNIHLNNGTKKIEIETLILRDFMYRY